MKIREIAGTLLLPILALGLTMLFASPVAHADDYHLTTVLTFNRPIQLPGNRVLPPGTYRFRLFDPENDLDVVAIYDASRPHIEALLETRPTYRANPTSRTELTLARQSKGMPDVLLRWFFPGREYGFHFIYSRQMQKRLDRELKLNVLVPSDYIQ